MEFSLSKRDSPLYGKGDSQSHLVPFMENETVPFMDFLYSAISIVYTLLSGTNGSAGQSEQVDFQALGVHRKSFTTGTELASSTGGRMVREIQ